MSTTIHRYVHRGDEPPSTASLLQAGRKVAQWSCARHGWFNVIPRIAPKTSESTGNVYRFALSPPEISTGDRLFPVPNTAELKEWGDDLDDDAEIYAIADLPDFQSGLPEVNYNNSPARIPSGTKHKLPFQPSSMSKHSNSYLTAPLCRLSETFLQPTTNQHEILDLTTTFSHPLVISDQPTSSADLTEDSLIPGLAHSAAVVDLRADQEVTEDPQAETKITHRYSSQHTGLFITYDFEDASIPGFIHADRSTDPGLLPPVLSITSGQLPPSEGADVHSSPKDPPSLLRLAEPYTYVQSESDTPVESPIVEASVHTHSIPSEPDNDITRFEEGSGICIHESSAIEDSEDPAILVHHEVTVIEAQYHETEYEEDEDELPLACDKASMKSLYLWQSHSYGSPDGTEDQILKSGGEARYLEGESLLALIPSPHFYVAPEALVNDEFNDKSTSDAANTFIEHKPRPIPPHTDESVSKLLHRPFARCAWVIPVRGIPPWAASGATEAAVVADPSSITNISTLPKRCRIIWSADSLLSFWDYLRSVREAGICGPIGLSFQTARTATTENDGRASGPPSLATLDYIKVYIDVVYAAKMRRVMDDWFYEPPRDGDEDTSWDFNEGTPIDINSEDGEDFGAKLELELSDEREEDVDKHHNQWCLTRQYLLRGASLPLLDEKNRGILLA